MSYLSREASTIPESLWKQIDIEVVKAARSVLTGRRFLHIVGPLGIGVQSINLDESDKIEETAQDGMITTKGRKYAEIPVIYDDFTLLSREIESNEKNGFPVDLSRAVASAEVCAIKEDRLIYFGNDRLGYKGLLTAPEAGVIEKKDWGAGENPFSDVAAAIELLASKSVYGKLALSVSPDLFMKMQRLQPGTGLLEIDRVSKLVDGHVYKTPVLGKDKAVLACSDARNMDLVVGQDMATAYLEQKDLNHSLRVLESVLPRIKRGQSIVIFS